MKSYSAIIVLATRPNPTNWMFPEQTYDCLDRAKQLLDKKQAPYIILSGKWSISFDNQGISQPFRECDSMADYLISKGLDPNKILKEGDSKDTISNLYYMKAQIFIPRHMRHLLFVVADFRIPRLQFLCERILGSEYTFTFEPIATEVGDTYNEPNTFNVQKKFLEQMKTGDHTWLANKFYSAEIYQG